MPRPEAGRPAAGVYVHLPFCARICPYCDFAVTVGRGDERRRLVRAIRREIERYAEAERCGETERRVGEAVGEIDSIYFGGGTPSLIEPDGLASLIETLRRELPVTASCRIFLEANPEDVTPGAVAAWRRIGVGTLSLGVQSLDARALELLGRVHTPRQAARAVETAGASGFETVSVDLIYALPGQTLTAWRRELKAAAALGPDHLSCYQLTVSGSTPFGRRRARGELVELAEPRQAELFLATHQTLAGLCYEGYEVSNFARSPRHRSRHNSKYWSGTPYLGFGPSAHSFVVPERWWNVAGSREYVGRLESHDSPVAGREMLSAADRLLERVMLGLRTTAGVDLEDLERSFEVALLEPNRRLIDAWSERGWVRVGSGRLRPTPAGLAVADHLAAALELPVPLNDRATA